MFVVVSHFAYISTLLVNISSSMSYDYRTRVFYIGPHWFNGLVSMAVQRVPSLPAWDIVFLEWFFSDAYRVDGLCTMSLNSTHELSHFIVLFDRHMHLTSDRCPYLIIKLSLDGTPQSMDRTDVVAISAAVQRFVYS